MTTVVRLGVAAVLIGIACRVLNSNEPESGIATVLLTVAMLVVTLRKEER